MVIGQGGTHMTRLGKMAGATAAIAALLLIAPPSEAQVNKKQPTQATKLTAVTKMTPTQDATKPHRLILQVNSNEPAMMNLALNNASNVAQYYQDLGEKVNIDIVTFGPGLHMLRDDTSPVKARIKALSESQPSISFEACGNTRENMGRAEGKEIPLISEAKVVKSGVVRVMELQEQGWTYVKP
ncbi:DsrE family protein [Bradyrhizobium sp. sGM-13]|uniref:DsrE family protein n=1 Tax=Bradyrhizobium sp. sGM-13 TaxID=2831781 RepID=UPI0020BFC946|nr:DsrE family protein [Bradyrhizobium sp. sGM-13]